LAASECQDSRLSQGKKAQFANANEHFFDKSNEEAGHSEQTTG
jgi:hypothetical protein